ncbi:hypothetical protein [Moraxella sp. ZY210820]|nr:hypothetical protein [Moraxella sp. ZY210820]WLF83349.1 hypothetical protein LU301_08770 [Moraxella sp. ZY210820]
MLFKPFSFTNDTNAKNRFYTLAMKDEIEKMGELVELMKKYCPSNQK